MKTILHVDDENDIREITQLSLEMAGDFIVHSAASGKDALRVVDDLSPDVILLDVMMPEMTGPEVCKALRLMPRAKEIPVVFMTAAAQKEKTDQLLRTGAIGVIEKPFDPMSLSAQVADILSAADTLNTGRFHNDAKHQLRA